MARRVPKPLVPILVVASAIGLATAAALPSFAGPIITPGPDGTATTAPATPSATPATPSATPTDDAPAPIPTMSHPKPPGPKDSPSPGPKDCSNCAEPPTD